MTDNIQQPIKKIVDRELLMRLKSCEACKSSFNLGEPVVLACGAWEGPAKWIHEEDAVFDPKSNTYVERKCFKARQVLH